MDQPLFRQEAIKHQGERLWGDLILIQPVSYYLLTAFLVFSTSVAIIFLIFNDYHRKQSVIGMLMPDKGIVAIYPPQPGLLIELYVNENNMVERGDDLFRLQLDQEIVSGDYISKRLLNELNTQEDNLLNKIKLENSYLYSSVERHNARISQLSQEISKLQELVEIQEQIELVESNSYLRAKKLFSQGIISISELDIKQKNYLEQKNLLNNLLLRQSTAQSTLMETGLEKNSLILNNKRTIIDIESELSEIIKEKSITEGERSVVIRSPIRGHITTVIADVGQRVDLNVPVFSILPDNSTLEAHLYVPTRAIGFLNTGQEVKIRYDAFPYQRFGLYQAKIIQVTNSVLAKSELPIALPVNDPVYKVIASLEKQQITAHGDEISLKPGMTLSADVILEQRTLFEWLFEPLYSITGKL